VASAGRLLPVLFLKAPGKISAGTLAMTPDQAARMLQMLSAVTRPGGTAGGVFDGLPASVAGKTGSAQNNQGLGRTPSWLVGVAPPTTRRSPSPASSRMPGLAAPPPRLPRDDPQGAVNLPRSERQQVTGVHYSTEPMAGAASGEMTK